MFSLQELNIKVEPEFEEVTEYLHETPLEDVNIKQEYDLSLNLPHNEIDDSLSQLNQSQLDPSQLSIWPCFYCHKIFKRKWAFDKHKCDNSDQLSCSKCWQIYNANKAIRHSLEYSQGKKREVMKEFECFNCTILTRFPQSAYSGNQLQMFYRSMKRPRRATTGSYNHPCPSCSKQFMHKSTLNNHLKYACGGIEPKFECFICGHKCRYKTGLVYHFKHHHSELVENAENENRPHPCKNCNNVYKSKQSLDAHVKFACLNRKSFECLYCDHKCNWRSSMMYHIKRYHLGGSQLNSSNNLLTNFPFENESMFHPCPDCGNVYRSKPGLQNHMKFACGDKKPFECFHCGHKANWKSSIAYHIKRHHLSDKVVRKRERGTSLGYIPGPPFACPICSHSYQTRAGLSVHMKYACTNQKLFECFHCGHKCNWKSSMVYHITRHHSGAQPKPKRCRYEISPSENGTYKCPECEKIYRSRQALYAHRKFACGAQKNKYECFYCGFRCNWKLSMSFHMERHHSFKGSSNGMKIKGRSKVKMEGIDVFNCPTCNREYKSLQAMKAHLKFACGDKKKFVCTICGHRCNWKASLLFHIERHHSTNEKKVREYRKRGAVVEGESHTCPNCYNKYKSRQMLMTHLKFACGNKKSFECYHCGHKCNWKTSIIYHINRYHLNYKVTPPTPKIQKFFQCSKCYNVYKSLQGMRNHSKFACGNKKPFQCFYCGHKCNWKSSILYHIRRYHSKKMSSPGKRLSFGKRSKRIYSCSKCNHSYRTPAVLSTHMKYACGNKKPFECFHCGHKCNWKSSLKSHIERHHVDPIKRIPRRRRTSVWVPPKGSKPPYTCPNCTNVYQSASGLTAHLKYACETSNTFVCFHCDHKCNFKSSLLYHITRHHLPTKKKVQRRWSRKKRTKARNN